MTREHLSLCHFSMTVPVCVDHVPETWAHLAPALSVGDNRAAIEFSGNERHMASAINDFPSRHVAAQPREMKPKSR